MAEQPTTEQYLVALDRATVQLSKFLNEVLQQPPPAQQAAQPKVAELRETVKKLRILALRSIRPGDAWSLTRAIGVGHAYDVFLELGIGSLPALVCCTERQFMRIARPPAMGWGRENPPQTDPSVVIEVKQVLLSLSLKFHDPASADSKALVAKFKVKYPEPVLSQAFKPDFDSKKRFTGDSFNGYGNPSIVNGIANKFDSIVKGLYLRGIYCWDDLTKHTTQDLVRAGFPGVQIPVVQYEMRRRGLFFLKEEKPSIVYQDMFDVDKMVAAACKDCGTKDKDGNPVPLRWNPEAAHGAPGHVCVLPLFPGATTPCIQCKKPVDLVLVDPKDQFSFEDRVVVKNKDGKRQVIDVKDDAADLGAARMGTDDDEAGAAAGDGVYVEAEEVKEVDVTEAAEEAVGVSFPQAEGVAFVVTPPPATETPAATPAPATGAPSTTPD
jgi:hypothetical protein